VSYPVEHRSYRKVCLALLVLVFAVPGLCGGRWVSFGPDGNLHVSAIRADRSDQQVLYIGADRGVFVSHDQGVHWDEAGNGLHGYAVLALEQALSGTWVAGTSHGIFLLPPNATSWRSSNTVVNEQGTPRMIHVKGVTRQVMAHHATRSVLQSPVNDIEIAPNRWLAATMSGIFSSSDQGKIWSGGPVNREKEFITIKAEKELVAAATRSKVFVSMDGGTVWKQATLASTTPVSIYDVVISPDARIFVATSEGLSRSSDGGATWEHVKGGLPAREVAALSFDPQNKRLLAASDGTVFESRDRGQTWRQVDKVGSGVTEISVVTGRLFVTTSTGVLADAHNSPNDPQDASRAHGNWFLRLVHKTD
jgi:ligand-binding sensor domain-containing protein